MRSSWSISARVRERSPATAAKPLEVVSRLTRIRSIRSTLPGESSASIRLSVTLSAPVKSSTLATISGVPLPSASSSGFRLFSEISVSSLATSLKAAKTLAASRPRISAPGSSMTVELPPSMSITTAESSPGAATAATLSSGSFQSRRMPQLDAEDPLALALERLDPADLADREALVQDLGAFGEPEHVAVHHEVLAVAEAAPGEHRDPGHQRRHHRDHEGAHQDVAAALVPHRAGAPSPVRRAR